MATVLVVDDEFGIVDVIDTILTDEGYRVLSACNGKQGLARLAEEKPDMVLLDFMMPILGGAEMLRVMAAEFGLSAHPGHHDEFARGDRNRQKMWRLRRVPAQAFQGSRAFKNRRSHPRQSLGFDAE